MVSSIKIIINSEQLHLVCMLGKSANHIVAVDLVHRARVQLWFSLDCDTSSKIYWLITSQLDTVHKIQKYIRIAQPLAFIYSSIFRSLMNRIAFSSTKLDIWNTSLQTVFKHADISLCPNDIVITEIHCNTNRSFRMTLP